jgi:hypothetical protein
MMDEPLAARNRKIADDIRQYGWHCLHVAGCEVDEQPFSYSIGFSQSHSAPEVLIFGLPPEKAHALLNACDSVLGKGHAIRPGVEDPSLLSGGYKVVFRTVRPECFDEYLGTAQRYYQDRPFDAVVMFLPDREHRYPWQAGYDYIPSDEALAIVRQSVGPTPPGGGA